MSKNVQFSVLCLIAGSALTLSSACSTKSSTSTSTITTAPTTTPDPIPSTGSSGSTTVYGDTLLFTPQQFADALAATGAAPQIPGFVSTSYTGSKLVKASDLQGSSNAVIYDATYGGSYFGIDFSVFSGLSVQQAVSAYIQLQSGQNSGSYSQFVAGQAQSMILPNGQTLSLWTPPYAQPGAIEGSGSTGGGGAIGSSGGGSWGSGGVYTPYSPVNPSENGFAQGTINVVFQDGTDTNGVPIFDDPGGNLYSDASQSRDTDLQQADLQNNKIEQNAQNLVTQFQMNADSARQLSVLADKMTQMTANGQAMTDEDRSSLSDAAFAVAGVSGDEVNAAAAKMIQTGDKTAVNDLLEKAATNLGMSSSTGLRDVILPSLGIAIGNE